MTTSRRRSAPRTSDEAAIAARRPEPSAIAQLLFTSGSTGEPKGVLHRHEVLDRAADAHIAHFGLRADDVIYIPSPLAHQTGWLYGMWIAWRLGATQVIQESWDAEIGVRRDRASRGHVHAGGDAVPRRSGARRRRSAPTAAQPAADVRRDRRRDPA